MISLERTRRLLDHHEGPLAAVDGRAFQHNLQRQLDALPPGVDLRLATKSVRVPAALERALPATGAQGAKVVGLMTYRAAETRWWAERAPVDLWCAYPVATKGEATQLAEAARRAPVSAVVDDLAQVHRLAQAGAAPHLRLVIDVDGSWRPGGLHLGVRRSPLRRVQEVLTLARQARDLGFRVEGLQLYEAQVAGLPDRGHPPGVGPILQLIKARSRRLAAARRREFAAALRSEGHEIRQVNGGGTGSLHQTGQDGSVTEVAAGSALLAPHLFDGYRGLALQPALFLALVVTRRSDPGFATCAGGGVVASGPPGPDRAPKLVWPPGWRPLPGEGFGEVQTPLQASARAAELQIGDPVLLRPAKAGETLERFDEIWWFDGEDDPVCWPTYRGLGRRFW